MRSTRRSSATARGAGTPAPLAELQARYGALTEREREIMKLGRRRARQQADRRRARHQRRHRKGASRAGHAQDAGELDRGPGAHGRPAGLARGLALYQSRRRARQGAMARARGRHTLRSNQEPQCLEAAGGDRGRRRVAPRCNQQPTQAAGFSTATFADAESFLHPRLGARAACLVADMRMPGMSGLRALPATRRLGRADPDRVDHRLPSEATRSRAREAGIVVLPRQAVRPRGAARVRARGARRAPHQSRSRRNALPWRLYLGAMASGARRA